MSDQIPASQPKPKWYFRGSTIFIGFLLVGPFVLPLVWAKPEYSVSKKVIVSALIVIVTVALFVSTPFLLNWLLRQVPGVL